MDPNTQLSIKEKIGNAFKDILFTMQSDKRVFFAVVGIVLLVAIFLVFVFISIFSTKKQNLTVSQSPIGSLPSSRNSISQNSQQKSPAILSLVAENKKADYTVGDTITIMVIGDTAGNQTRGYDAVFKFDMEKVQFINEKNLYPSFNYQRRIRDNWIIITSSQPLSSRKKNILHKTSLMQLTFKAKAVGTAYFPMSYIPDATNDSNLIDPFSNDMLTNATGVVIQILP